MNTDTRNEIKSLLRARDFWLRLGWLAVLGALAAFLLSLVPSRASGAVVVPQLPPIVTIAQVSWSVNPPGAGTVTVSINPPTGGCVSNSDWVVVGNGHAYFVAVREGSGAGAGKLQWSTNLTDWNDSPAAYRPVQFFRVKE